MTDLATLGIRVQTGDLKEGATALSTLTTHGKQAERATDALAATARRSGTQVGAFGGQIKAASGSTANLVAQFNDIGIMMAAGQNPLQLALQQGTQINQVFAQLGGGRGAIRAVGAAFMSLLSPINLATIGIIAFGGAAVNWLMQARNEAETLDEVTDRLSNTLRRLQDAGDMTRLSMDELSLEYGDNAEAARENLREILELERAIASQGLRDAIDALGDAFDEMFGPSQLGRGGAQELAESLGLPIDAVKVLAREAHNLKGALTFEDQQNAIADIGRVFADMGVPLEKLPRELLEGLRHAANLEDVMLALEAAIGGSADEAARLARSLPMTRNPGMFNPLLDGDGNVLPGDQLIFGGQPGDIPEPPGSRGGGGRPARDPRADEAARIFDETRTAAERYAAELADLNELQQMGYINAETYGRAVDALKDQFDTGSGMAETFGRSIANLGADMVLNFGKGEDAVESLLNSLARLVVNSAFQQFVQPGITAGLDSLFGGGTAPIAGARAMGGPVTGGRTYLVGERGPELFTPSSSGGITPNHAMGGAPAQITINNYSGQPVEAQRGPNGRIDVTIGKQMAAALRGDPDVRRAMAQGYGLTGAG